jgi:hypothetical protein
MYSIHLQKKFCVLTLKMFRYLVGWVISLFSSRNMCERVWLPKMVFNHFGLIDWVILLVIQIHFIIDLNSEYDAYTERIAKYVAAIFPEKHITPIAFRRMIPTLMWENDVHIPGATMKELLEKYSRLVNTSEKVTFICLHFLF